MVQWLGFCTFTAEGVGSIPVWGAKTLASCVVQPEKEEKKKEISTFKSSSGDYNEQEKLMTTDLVG